jgi:hypothetical protein
MSTTAIAISRLPPPVKRGEARRKLTIARHQSFEVSGRHTILITHNSSLTSEIRNGQPYQSAEEGAHDGHEDGIELGFESLERVAESIQASLGDSTVRTAVVVQAAQQLGRLFEGGGCRPARA